MDRSGRLWIISAIGLCVLGACAPIDSDHEQELGAEELDDDVEVSGLRYAGTLRLKNGLNGYCAYRSGSRDVRVQACTGGASEYWEAYQLTDGTYAVCKPGTYRSFTNYDRITNGITETGTMADCMVRSGDNKVYVEGYALTVRSYSYNFTTEASGAWSQSGANILWGGSSRRRLTVVGTGVGLYNDNGNPASQSWSLLQ